ncbi:MAG: 1-deoxy-D-xylulose-5-phosphate reductoisomerase [Thermodesulfovibrionales bacterium]
MKNISVLGSTGSIGQSTLDVVASHRDRFRVVALAAGRNCDLLERQIREFRPEIVAVADSATADRLRPRVNGVKILAGSDGICEAAACPRADFVLSAIVGAAGLLPTMAALGAGKDVGLANKEALVIAGGLVMAEAKRRNVRIIPVDSEHSAVFQCIEGRKTSDVRRIVLTASGGPFLNRTRQDLETITAEDALRHPNWSMGRKITIDSATLMNKGLEVIEACWLFGMPPDRVDVLIHPQSIVHSMVEFRDRSTLAQLSAPDMRGPIAYALSWPDRFDDPIPGLELDRVGSLTFRKPDHDAFPCLSYAYDAIRQGGTAPAVLNAANEVAVHAFLENRIGFTEIAAVIRSAMSCAVPGGEPDMAALLSADQEARRFVENALKEMQRS